MTRDELLKRYAAGERDFNRADLRGADLRGAYLRGAYLSGAYLSGAYLSGAYLRGAYLSGAYLSGADLSGAYLSGAYLSGADLSGAYLSGAYLRGAPDNDEEPKIKLLGPVENLGIDERGYTLWAFRAEGGLDDKGRWVISAGCRFFESLTDALRHWGSPSYENPKRGRWFVRRIKLLWDE